MRHFKVRPNQLRKYSSDSAASNRSEGKVSPLEFLEAADILLAQAGAPEKFLLDWVCLLVDFSLPASLNLVIQSAGNFDFAPPATPETRPLSFLINRYPYRGTLWQDSAKVEISLNLATQPEASTKTLTDFSKALGSSHRLQLGWVQDSAWSIPSPEVRRSLLLAVSNLSRYLEKVSLEQQLEKMRQAEQHRLNLLRQADHDLRGPFASLVVAADILVEKGLDLPATELRQLLQRLKRNAGLLNRLLDNYLSIPQLTAAGLNRPPNLQPLEVLPRLCSLVELISPQLERKAQTLEIEPAHLTGANLPPVMADSHFFDQVVLNLLYNAHRHTPAETHIRLQVTVEDSYLKLAVVDNGPGVAAEIAPRLEALFNEKSKKADTTGLGLKLVCELTIKQYGQAGFNSTSDGATFWIKLPTVKV